MWKCKQRIIISKTILKKNKVERFTLPDFKICYNAMLYTHAVLCIIKTMSYFHKGRYIDQ